MPCFHPLTGWRSRQVNPSGKRSLVFVRENGYVDLPVVIPCSQCIGCRLERSRQWAVRCVHEASLYEQNCFITLTYDNEHLPPNGTLVLEDFQKFMKRLRKRFGSGIRFFHCGEYGEKFSRPHYHACIFNFDFPDKELWSVRDGVPLYISEALSDLWSDCDPVNPRPLGFSTIGSVTFESAAYVARYITKKVIGDLASSHYEVVDSVSGEVIGSRKPEYTTMSRRPGIGGSWFDRFSSDVYPGDFVVLEDRKFRPPKYYDRRFELDDPDGFRKVVLDRKRTSLSRADDNSVDRLAVREELQFLKFDRLKRGYERDE